MLKNRGCNLSLLVGLLFVASAGFAADTAQPDKKGVEFFESKIRPVLVQNCYKCHSAAAAAEKKLKGELQLDSRSGIRKGGEGGPAIVPGKVADSILIDAIRHEDLKMPPTGKLPDDVIANFVKWVEMGAPDPRDSADASAAKSNIDIVAGKLFWSFQPLANDSPPKVQNHARVRTPVDQFIFDRQEKQNVKPNDEVDRRTLIRRAYYDLLGLPPSPEEVAAFVNDSSSQAYEQLIDRLMESEHYGERWARHWLDLVRFAESNGYAFDKDRAAAYHYRDFVIKAFNSDMPYDQFVRLQIAGEQIAPNDFDAIAATGFLVAGPFTTQQTQKERERSRYEQLDDMFVTLGTSMLGLTVGCARCHDHKYDPIPQHDYYRVVSAFAEVGFVDFDYDPDPEGTRLAKAEFDKAHQPLVDQRVKYEKEQLPDQFNNWLADRRPEPKPPALSTWQWIGPFAGASFDKAFDDVFDPEKETELVKSYQDGKLKWTEQPAWKDGAVHNTLTGDNAANYLYRTIDSEYDGPAELSLGSDDAIKVWLNGQQVLAKKISRAAAADQEKVSLPLKKGRNELLMKIVNGGGGSGFYFKLMRSGPPDNVLAILKTPSDKWNDKQRTAVLNWYRTQDDEWRKLDAAVQEHLKQQPKPNLVKVYSAKKRGTSYNFGGDSYKVYFLTRGNTDQKQELATPGYLQVLSNVDSASGSITDKPAKESPARQAEPTPPRVALADWLTDTQHGSGHLLARVIVNRLWQHHMGRGLVATPSDFGTRGERPTHPELLDWLGQQLITNGWKLKPIHRLIMTSSVYRQTGAPNEANMKLDPNNKLWWRRPAQRLEAEIIRDALLAVSGTLDEKMFGPGTRDEKTTRRSIYLTVKRSELIPILQLFDAPDAMQGIGQREKTTVPAQALAMMNSPVVRDWAVKLAQRVRAPRDKQEKPTEQLVSDAYEVALSRPPNDDELKQMLAFIDRQTKSYAANAKASEMAFADFCHVLLCLNEFVYVD